MSTDQVTHKINVSMTLRHIQHLQQWLIQSSVLTWHVCESCVSCLTVLQVTPSYLPPKYAIVSNSEKTWSFDVGTNVLKSLSISTRHCASLWHFWKHEKHLSERLISPLATARFSSVVNSFSDILSRRFCNFSSTSQKW